jgi:hypothetical protein
MAVARRSRYRLTRRAPKVLAARAKIRDVTAQVKEAPRAAVEETHTGVERNAKLIPLLLFSKKIDWNHATWVNTI